MDALLTAPHTDELDESGALRPRGDGAIHDWFGLTYSNYLVLPRSLLQAMPHEWQERFVACLDELREEWDSGQIGDNYSVYLRGDDGRYRSDPLANYRHPDRTLIESLRRKKDR